MKITLDFEILGTEFQSINPWEDDPPQQMFVEFRLNSKQLILIQGKLEYTKTSIIQEFLKKLEKDFEKQLEIFRINKVEELQKEFKAAGL